MVDCDVVRAELLQLDWDETSRKRMGDVLAHLNSCDSCQSTMEDFDRMRLMLALPESEVEPVHGWSAFEAGLTQTISSRRLRWRPLPLALAASILLAAVGWGLYLGRDYGSQLPQESGDGRIFLTALTPDELADRVNLFDEMSDVFEGRTGWVLVADQASDVGLGRDPADTIGKLLLLRLSVSRAEKVFSTADLVIAPGQTARLTVPSVLGPALSYQIATSSSDPTRFQLWAQVERPNGASESAAVLATDLRAEPGRVMSAGEMVTPYGRYRVNVGLYQAELPAQSL